MEETCVGFLWFKARAWFLLTPVRYCSLSQRRGLDSSSRVKVCSPFPTDGAASPDVPAVFVNGGPGVRISASLRRFLSSLLPSACHEHQIFFPLSLPALSA